MSLALIVSFGVTLLAFGGLWLLSLRRRDASVVDFYWGPGFVVIGWTAWSVLALVDGRARIDASLLVLLAVTIWGVRLGIYILSRHRGVEDARYAAMRARHGASWPLKSLFYVFLLQAVIQWIAASAVLVSVVAPSGQISPLFLLGGMLFAGGFLLEMLADRAVARFKADPSNRGRLLTTGLHGIVRYPGYLGEIILQWGLSVMAFALTSNPLAFVGAALMTTLIITVSGVPMLEAMFRERDGYADWAARTGTLLPKLSGKR